MTPTCASPQRLAPRLPPRPCVRAQPEQSPLVLPDTRHARRRAQDLPPARPRSVDRRRRRQQRRGRRQDRRRGCQSELVALRQLLVHLNGTPGPTPRSSRRGASPPASATRTRSRIPCRASAGCGSRSRAPRSPPRASTAPTRSARSSSRVKSAYISAVLARDNLDFALQVQTGGNQIFQLNQTRYNAGAISEADLAKVETMKLEADQAVDMRRAGAARGQGAAGVSPRRARHACPTTRSIRICRSSACPRRSPTPPPTSLIARRRRSSPRSQGARAAARSRARRRSRSPSASVSPTSASTRSTRSKRAPTNNAVAAADGVASASPAPFPLFYFQQGEIKKAEADYAHAAAAARQDRGAARRRRRVARTPPSRRRASSSSAWRRACSIAPSARAISCQLQYQKGAASLLEYLDAQRTFIANNVEYLQDLAELLDRRLSARSGGRDGARR